MSANELDTRPPKIPLDVKIPGSRDFDRASKVAGLSIAGAQYLYDRAQVVLGQKGLLPYCQETIASLKNFLLVTQMKFMPISNPWTGEFVPDVFHNMTGNMARVGKAMLSTVAAENPARMDFAVNEKGDFLRGFAYGNGVPSNVTAVAGMDKLFTAWLGEPKTEDGLHFEFGENNKLMVREKNAGELRAMTPQDKILLETAIADEDKGFSSFLKGKGVPIEINTVKNVYPGEAKVTPKEEIVAEQFIEEVVKEAEEEKNQTPGTRR